MNNSTTTTTAAHERGLQEDPVNRPASAAATVSLTEKVVEGFVMVVLWVVTVGGQGCLVGVLVSSRELVSSCNLLIMELAVTDLLVALTFMPVTAACFFVDGWEVSYALCEAESFLCCLLLSVHAFTLCSIAYTRYIRYCRYAFYCVMLFRLWVPVNVIAIWGVSATLAALALKGRGDVGYVAELCVCLPTSSTYCLFLVIILYGLTSLLLLFFYIKVGSKLKEHSHPVMLSVANSFDPRLDSGIFTILLPYPTGKSRSDKRVTCINNCMWNYLIRRRDSIMHEAFVNALEHLKITEDLFMSESVVELMGMGFHPRGRPKMSIVSSMDATCTSEMESSREGWKRKDSIMDSFIRRDSVGMRSRDSMDTRSRADVLVPRSIDERGGLLDTTTALEEGKGRPSLVPSLLSNDRERPRFPVLVHKLGDGVSRRTSTSPTFQSSGASCMGGFTATTQVIDFRAHKFRDNDTADILLPVRKEEMEIGSTVISLILSFLLPTLPAALLCMLHALSSLCVEVWVARMSLLLLLSHVALIPLFYGWMHFRIRRAFLVKLNRLFPRCYAKRRVEPLHNSSTPSRSGVAQQDSSKRSVTHQDSPKHSVTHQDSPKRSVTHQDNPKQSVTHPDSPVHSVTHQDSSVHSVTHPDSPMRSVTHQYSLKRSVTHPDSPEHSVTHQDSHMHNVAHPDSPKHSVTYPYSPEHNLAQQDSPKHSVTHPDSPMRGVTDSPNHSDTSN